MRRLAAALPLTLLAAAVAAAAPARAAQVQTDRGCYLQTQSTNVTVSGSGFAAARPYAVALDGKPLSGGAAATDANGAMQGTISPPSLTAQQHEHIFDLAVSADDVSADTKFTVTRFLADFSPSRHVAPDSRVRFSVYGFGLARANPAVYLHYADPAGHLRATVRLGRARGQCGSIGRTARHRLFPFHAPRHGKWRLQFDTSKAYRRGKVGSPFLFFTIGVDVHAPRRRG